MIQFNLPSSDLSHFHSSHGCSRKKATLLHSTQEMFDRISILRVDKPHHHARAAYIKWAMVVAPATSCRGVGANKRDLGTQKVLVTITVMTNYVVCMCRDNF